MRKLIAAIILLLALCGGACARLPQIGDDVTILTSGGDFCIQKRGTINDIGNGFLCIQEIGYDGKIYDDICFGIGAIAELYWND